MSPLKTLAAATLCLVSTLAAAQTRGTDGVTPIHQDSALAGGVTAADTPGFPITIATSGTYRLTSNLVVPAGKDGIVVNPSLNVVIDLNGFQIVGPAACSFEVDCRAWSGGTAGVRSEHPTTSLTVRNGRVRGFSSAGISALGTTSGGDLIAEDLQLTNNYIGVIAARLMATRVVARANSWHGIALQDGFVRLSIAESNNVGIQLSKVGRISESVVTRNRIGVRASPTAKTLLHYSNVQGNTTNVTEAWTAEINVL